MDSNKMGKVEAISIVIIIMITHIIINLPQTLMKSTGASTALNVLYISIISLIFSFAVVKLFQLFPGCDIFDVAEFLAGKWLKIVLQILFLLYILAIASFVLRTFTLNLQVIYFSNIDIATILLVFLIGASIVSHFGFATIVRTNLIFLPLTLFAMLVLFLSTLTNWGIENFLPVLGNGWNETFLSGLSNLYAVSGINILFLLIPQLKDPQDFKKVSLISVAISSIYLWLSVIASMLLIPADMNFEPIFTVYFAARRISLGDFLERLDPIFIFVWTLSVFSYLSIVLFYLSDIFKKTTHVQYRSPLLYAFAALCFVCAISITNVGQILSLLSTVYQYVTLLFIFGLCFMILLLAALKKKLLMKKSFLHNPSLKSTFMS